MELLVWILLVVAFVLMYGGWAWLIAKACDAPFWEVFKFWD